MKDHFSLAMPGTSIIISLTNFLVYFLLFRRWREAECGREGEEQKASSTCIHAPNAQTSQDWVELKPGHRNSIEAPRWMAGAHTLESSSADP